MKSMDLVAALICLILLESAAYAIESRKKDLNADGYQEAEVFYDGKNIVRMWVDSDRDKIPDSVVYFKNGLRDYGEADRDHDGNPDLWVYYYFTGAPWKIAEDMNRDGAADYWMYFKNGKIYRWEQDRDRDGKADVKTVYDAERVRAGKKVLLQQSFDNDFDGIFESVSGITLSRKEAQMPHSLAEALLAR